MQTTIKTLTSHVRAMADIAGSTDEPVEAYHLVSQVDALLVTAASLLEALDTTLEQHERLAQEFKQKAEAARDEPQKARVYQQKASEILEQTDLLFILQQELAAALASLRDQSEGLKSQSQVAYLLAVDRQTDETEAQKMLDAITALVDSEEKPAVSEQQQLLTQAREIVLILAEKRTKAKALAAECRHNAEQYQTDPEKARVYTQTALKLEQHEERLFVLKHKLEQAIAALEDAK